MSSKADQDRLPDPDVGKGIEYWASQPASYDGVLGESCVWFRHC